MSRFFFYPKKQHLSPAFVELAGPSHSLRSWRLCSLYRDDELRQQIQKANSGPSIAYRYATSVGMTIVLLESRLSAPGWWLVRGRGGWFRRRSGGRRACGGCGRLWRL